MRVLILGGTQFVGRHIGEALLAAGYTVSALTRGVTMEPLPSYVERLRGDRDAGREGLAALAGATGGACVDVSGYTPRHVRASSVLLRGHPGRYVLVSAVSVYGDPTLRPVTESHPLLAPAPESVTEVDAKTYGPLKVACKRIVQELYGGRSACLHPQIAAAI